MYERPHDVPLVEEVHNAPDAAGAFEAFRDRPFSFFLDSGMDRQRLGRWSFMGSDPFLVMKSRGRDVRLIDAAGERPRPRQHDNLPDGSRG